MNVLTRWNPFRQHTRFDPTSAMDDLFRGLGLQMLSRDPEAPLEMRLDVREEDKAYRVSVDLPGVDKDKIEVLIDGNQVSIQADVERESRKEEGKEIHTERYFGRAFRSFTLPQDVDPDSAQASYEKGVLMLTLPKKPGGHSHRISVT